MPSRPPHTTACTRSPGGSCATGMRRRMRCRTRSSGHGGSCGGFGIRTLRRLAPSTPRQRSCRRSPASGHGSAPRCRRRARSINRRDATRSRGRWIVMRSIAPSADCSFEQRAVVVLTHYAGLTGPEVAEILGIPVGTVASRLHYGAPCHARGDRSVPEVAIHRRGARPMTLPHGQPDRGVARRRPRMRPARVARASPCGDAS